MFDSGKRAFHIFIENTSWQIQANGTGHTCVFMVDNAETTLVIYGSMRKLDVFIEMTIEHAVIFNKKELKLFSADA